MKGIKVCLGLLFLTYFANAQINLKFSTKQKGFRKTKVDSVFAYQQKPYFLLYSIKKANINLCSMQVPTPKTIFFRCNGFKEIDLKALNYQTKMVFFKMKMWHYFQ